MSGFETDLTLQALQRPFLVAFLSSFAICAVLVLTQRWHGHVSNDHLNGPQKFHKHAVPRIGGAAIAAAFLFTWPFLPDDLQPFWTIVGLAAVPAFAAGLIEDFTRRVGVRWRLLATMGAGVVFALLSGYTMHKVDLPGVDWLLAVPVIAVIFTGFSMGGVANAINIVDGFNGLASGTLLIMLGAFAYVAHQVGDPLVFSLALLYAALILGFFVLNFPLGKIFLGDGGAYFCGFLLATLGVLLPTRNPEISAWAAILICAYPVIETLASMRRKSRREGYSIGQPDRVHFHMLAYRRYARRLVRRPDAQHLRNPATSMVTWFLPLFTTALVAISYESALLSAIFFLFTVYLYTQIYRIMSLNATSLPLGIARLF